MPTNEDKFNLATQGKQGKVADNGTTIVFYDLSNKNINLDTEGYSDIAAADDKLKKSFTTAIGQIEEVANIKFFDINNLTREQKAYLASVNVNISEQPDIVVRKAAKIHVDEYQHGISDYPRDNKIEFSNINPRSYNFGNSLLFNFDSLVLHEILHTLGLTHTTSDESLLPQAFDNGYNSEQSYNQKKDGVLGPIDIYSLIKQYGKNPNYKYDGLDVTSLLKNTDKLLGIEFPSVDALVNESKNINGDEKKIYNDLKQQFLEGGINQDERQFLNSAAVLFETFDIKKADISDSYENNNEINITKLKEKLNNKIAPMLRR